jgi:hypothetical protein
MATLHSLESADNFTPLARFRDRCLLALSPHYSSPPVPGHNKGHLLLLDDDRPPRLDLVPCPFLSFRPSSWHRSRRSPDRTAGRFLGALPFGLHPSTWFTTNSSAPSGMELCMGTGGERRGIPSQPRRSLHSCRSVSICALFIESSSSRARRDCSRLLT